MLRFTSHSKWVQETTKMVCRSPEWRSGKSTVCSGTDCSTPTGWSCQASTQPHARTGQRYRAFPVFYQCTRRSNQALSDWSTPTRSFSQASTNSTPELVEVTRPSVSTGPIKREATGPHRTACPNKPFKRRVYAVFDSCTRRCSPTSTNLLNSSEENHTSTVLLTPWERTTQSVTDLHTSTEQNRPIKEACTVF